MLKKKYHRFLQGIREELSIAKFGFKDCFLSSAKDELHIWKTRTDLECLLVDYGGITCQWVIVNVAYLLHICTNVFIFYIQVSLAFFVIPAE